MNKQRKTRQEKGITLIALIITIVVLLILAVVAIRAVQDNGIIDYAKNARDDYQAAQDDEEAMLQNYLNVLNENNQNGGKEYKAYAIGDEVTVGGESFYVIEETGSSEATVTLLAKYNLNKEGTAQTNSTYSETDYAFSSTNYWSSETNYPLDLNEYTIPEGVTSVITTAKIYGEAKGGTGRLMTYEKAEELATSHPGIIYGTSIDATDGYLSYWLGSTHDIADHVWVCDGRGEGFGGGFSYAGAGFRCASSCRNFKV